MMTPRNSRKFLPLFLLAAALLPTGACAGARPTGPLASTAAQTAKRSSAGPTVHPHGFLGQDLFIAIGRRDLAGVQALLKRGADVNARNSLAMTPLIIAAASGQPDVMQVLMQAGAEIEPATPYGTPLTFASMDGIVPEIQLLLAKGANPDPSRPDGITVLMMLSRTGPAMMVSELLKRGAKVNARDNWGATPLDFAARAGNLEAGQLLLDSGALVDSADNAGWTPLMHAAATGHADFVQMLLRKGANVNARDAKGRSVLMLAATYGDYPDTVRALIAGGANPQATDIVRRTALSLAALHGHTETAAALASSSLDATAESNAPALRTPQAAVRLSLKAIQYSMLKFNRSTGCVSCHHEGLGRVVTGTALAKGFSLEPEAEKLEAQRVNVEVTNLKPLHAKACTDPESMKQVPLVEMGDLPIYYGYMFAGMEAHGQPASDATAAMAAVLATQQLPDGHWQIGAHRFPMESSDFTMTALDVHALRTYGPRSQAKEITDRISHAREWLLTSPAPTNEDRAFRLVGLKWSGATQAQLQASIDVLRDQQHSDGGWSQIDSMRSDAYATGQALYALHVGGVPVSDAAYAKGVRFLLQSQDDGGTWFVNKRAIPANNYFDAGFSYGESQYASFNGTCWATLALLQTLSSTPAHTSTTVYR